VAAVVEAAGLRFSAAVMDKIRARIERDGNLTRTELSREVCDWLDLRAANGMRRELSCRLALLDLDRRGELSLPERRRGVRRMMRAQRGDGIDDRPLRCGRRERASGRYERAVAMLSAYLRQREVK
jgi:hypothetical protein